LPPLVSVPCAGITLVTHEAGATTWYKVKDLGALPGDILIQRKNFTFSFPIVTCLIVSVVLTIIVNLFFRR